MWGPDLTIRALYITATLTGGEAERGRQRSGHVRGPNAHTPAHTSSGRRTVNTLLYGMRSALTHKNTATTDQNMLDPKSEDKGKFSPEKKN